MFIRLTALFFVSLLGYGVSFRSIWDCLLLLSGILGILAIFSSEFSSKRNRRGRNGRKRNSFVRGNYDSARYHYRKWEHEVLYS